MKLAQLPKTVVTGTKEMEVRGKPQQVPTFDFAKIRPQYAPEHSDGTGYPGSYHMDAKLTDTQHVSLTFEPDGNVRMLSKHFEPDPELGNSIGSEPSRYDVVRNLFPDELKSLITGLKAQGAADPTYELVLERMTGKKAPVSPNAGGVSKQLAPTDGQPITGAPRKNLFGEE